MVSVRARLSHRCTVSIPRYGCTAAPANPSTVPISVPFHAVGSAPTPPRDLRRGTILTR